MAETLPLQTVKNKHAAVVNHLEKPLGPVGDRLVGSPSGRRRRPPPPPPMFFASDLDKSEWNQSGIYLLELSCAFLVSDGDLKIECLPKELLSRVWFQD